MISGFTKAAILRAVLNGSTLAEAARQEHITTARGRSALQQLCRRLRLPAEASEIQAHVVCDFTMCGPLEFLSQSEVEVGEQFDTVLDRWDSAEGFMGSMVVVAVQPIGRHVAHFLQ